LSTFFGRKLPRKTLATSKCKKKMVKRVKNKIIDFDLHTATICDPYDQNSEGGMMKIVKGDLIQLALTGEFDVIIHGCNCFCTMGGGIARTIKQQFPQAYAADLATPEGDRSKLGDFSQAAAVNDGHTITIINAYTQYHYAGSGIKADYNAIQRVFEKLKIDFAGRRFGYPKIGAGLAGGDWQVISGIIDGALQEEDHTLVEFQRS